MRDEPGHHQAADQLSGSCLDVIRDELEAAVPSTTEEAAGWAMAREVLNLVETEVRGYPEILDVGLGGSFAKGTWLAGEADIDVFLRFRESASRETFIGVSKEVGFAALRGHDPYERYADHPYVEAEMNGTKVNVVPCYDVKPGRWKSAADRSPHHTRYMKEHLTDDMKDQVRLLKRFLKKLGLYGSSMERQGFSGYSAEVLVLHFGGFAEVLAGVARMRRGGIIGEAAKEFDTPLVIMDPVDRNRNLAAAISGRNMGLFIFACRAFPENPAGLFAEPEPVPRCGWDSVVMVQFGYARRNPEIVWGQARKASSALARQLERGGFAVVREKLLVDTRTIRMLFLLESLRIPPRFVRGGPNIFRRDAAAKFAQKGGLVWVSQDLKVMRLEERQYHDAAALLRHLLESPEKVGIPDGLHMDVGAGCHILEGEHIDQSVKREAAELLSTDAVLGSR